MIFWQNEVEDRTDRKIYTVDPVNSRDFDDAFGIEMCGDKPYYILSIYISNVSFWLDTLDLWESFQKEYLLFIYLIENVLCCQQFYQTKYVVWLKEKKFALLLICE